MIDICVCAEFSLLYPHEQIQGSLTIISRVWLGAFILGETCRITEYPGVLVADVQASLEEGSFPAVHLDFNTSPCSQVVVGRVKSNFTDPWYTM